MPRPLPALGLALASGAAGGAAYALAFPPYGLWPLAGVALVAPLVAVTFVKLGPALWTGFLFGLVHGAMSIHWLFNVFPGPFPAGLFIIYGAFYALFFGLARAVTERWGPGALCWAAPILWVGIEWFRCEGWWLKFGWFAAGAAAIPDLPLLQTASWWGMYGLSAIVVLVNASIAFTCIDRARWREMAAILLGLLGVHAIGAALLEAPRGNVAVAALEAGGSWEARIDEVMRKQPATRFVVLPEYAVGGHLDDDSEAMAAFARIARKHAIVIVFGSTARCDVPGEFYNTLFILGPDGKVVHRQPKSVPVQFMKDGLPAPDRAPAATPFGAVGCATCYDMDFPFVSRELVAEGAELLVYPTMDAYHWGRVQRVQHASLAPLRAVEHRRWVVRSATVGVSLIADPYGRVTEDRLVLLGAVEMRKDRTVYTRFGYFLPHLLAGMAVAIVLLAAKRRAPPAARP